MTQRVEELFYRMKDQLKSEDHPITFVIRSFQKNFIRDYETEILKHLPTACIPLPEVSDSNSDENISVDFGNNEDTKDLIYDGNDRINASVRESTDMPLSRES